MKKVLFGLVACTMLLASCKKDDDKNKYTCITCAKSPAALAANDASSKGIYKGVLIASSGIIEFNIANENSTITATMVIDGTTVTLTSNVTWTAGQSYIAPFTGTLNGNAVSITFSVEATGSNPVVVTSDIPGHPNASFTVVKETSNNLVECFEGRFKETPGSEGRFNVVLSRALQQWRGSYRKDNSNETSAIGGVINSANEMIDNTTGLTMATLSGDEVRGEFTNATPATVKVEGQRTW